MGFGGIYKPPPKFFIDGYLIALYVGTVKIQSLMAVVNNRQNMFLKLLPNFLHGRFIKSQ